MLNQGDCCIHFSSSAEWPPLDTGSAISPKAGPLNLRTPDFWAGYFFLVESCPVHYSMLAAALASVPWVPIIPLPSPSWDNQKCLQRLPDVPGDKIAQD